jgi:hypothetical protein
MVRWGVSLIISAAVAEKQGKIALGGGAAVRFHVIQAPAGVKAIGLGGGFCRLPAAGLGGQVAVARPD